MAVLDFEDDAVFARVVCLAVGSEEDAEKLRRVDADDVEDGKELSLSAAPSLDDFVNVKRARDEGQCRVSISASSLDSCRDEKTRDDARPRKADRRSNLVSSGVNLSPTIGGYVT